MKNNCKYHTNNMKTNLIGLYVILLRDKLEIIDKTKLIYQSCFKVLVALRFETR